MATARKPASIGKKKTTAKAAKPATNGELERYEVRYVALDKILPSPENDEMYGEIKCDAQMRALIASIRKRGLEEPIILTEDFSILSGHRRYFAVRNLGWERVPVRITKGVRRAGNRQFHRELAEFNPQRIKSVGALLKEALLRDQSTADTYAAIRDHEESSLDVAAEFMRVLGAKHVAPVSDKKRPFLETVQKVIEKLRQFWPLSIRQIHYNLLNDPPLTSVPLRSKFSTGHYAYRNNRTSYNALVRLLTSARYHGHIPMTCIDDPTRPQFTFYGPSVSICRPPGCQQFPAASVGWYKG